LTGVLVSSVEQDCEARDLGIVAGDVVVAVQGGLVSTPEDIRLAVRAAHQEHRPFLAVLIQAKAVARWVSLSIDSPGS
jgi:S1-C subfamily serine protease